MIIDENSRNILKEKFKNELKREVELFFFTKKEEEIPFEQLQSHLHHNEENKHCHFCDFVRRFLKELEEISEGKIKFREFEVDSEEGRKYSLERIPTVMIDPEKGYRIIYTGSPIGEESWAFIDTIIKVSKDESGLSLESKEKLKGIKGSEIKVFVTPECPYCPYQVLLVNSIAIEAKGRVKSECIESLENPDLAEKYNVMAVPYTLLNGKKEVIGVQNEKEFIDTLLKSE